MKFPALLGNYDGQPTDGQKSEVSLPITGSYPIFLIFKLTQSSYNNALMKSFFICPLQQDSKIPGKMNEKFFIIHLAEMTKYFKNILYTKKGC